MTRFTKKLRYDLYADFWNDFRNVIIVWWITWITILRNTQWLPDCHEVQIYYEIITAQGYIIAPYRILESCGFMVIALYRRLEGYGFMVIAPYWILEGIRFMDIAPYQLLKGSRFMIIAPYQRLEGCRFMDSAHIRT